MRKSLNQSLMGESLQNFSLDRRQATEAPQRLRNILSSLLFLIAVLLLWAVHRLAPIPDPLSMGLQTYGLLSLFLVIPYDGTRGYDKKWWRYFNYLYYPVHIAILALAFGLMIL